MEHLDQTWFDPGSVAVIGASATRGKWGHEYAKSLLSGRHRRRVYLVNPAGGEILGQPVFARCADLPTPPDLAVMCVPPARIEAAIAEVLDAGARRIVCLTAGFAETGAAGAAQQARIIEQVRAAGARLLGPNCFGLFDAAAEMRCVGFWDVEPGAVGLISQSGTVLLELSARLARLGQGFSRAISIGNQADTTAAEFIATFRHSAQTKLLTAYIEDFKDGRAVFSALEQLTASGLPSVLIAPGDTEPVRRAAASHTGSLVASDALVDAACEDAGVVRVRSVSAAMAAIRGLLAPTPLHGRRLAIVADGGGSALLGAAACAAAGLEAPAFSPALEGKVAELLQPGAGVKNPVDAVGALGLPDIEPAIQTILASPEIDGVLLSGALNDVRPNATPQDADSVAEAILTAAAARGKGLMIASMYPDDPAMQAFAVRGVPVFPGAQEAAEALAYAVRRTPLRPVAPIEPSKALQPPTADYFGARALFARYGAPFPAAAEVRDRDAARRAAAEIGYPVVLKAMGLLHKSDAGGVALGLAEEAALLAAFDDMTERLHPPAFSVEAMAGSGGVELILGGVQAARFGPVVTIGAGGVLTEVLRDSVTALAPVDVDHADRMLRRLRIARLFDGYRGQPPLDVAPLCELIARFSTLLAEHPQIAEAEINPLRLGPGGLLALDARILLSDEKG